MLVFQCSNSDTIITPSFYHWQTSFQLSKNEDHLLQQSNVHKLYIKFFDVDWSFQQNKAIPLASVIFPDKGIKDLEVVPTIFITNRTFLQIPPEKLDTLAQLVSLKIDQLGMGLHWKEVQIDCDWTRKTQSKYFDFLQSLKEILSSQSIVLSTTIRLHQLKYANQTGIPPSDKGMLMVYNVGTLESWKAENSIMTVDEVKPYLIPFEQYPLELDIALPIFAWGVVFREEKLIKLINNLRSNELQDTTQFLKVQENKFEVKKSGYIKGYYLYKGDRIRTESISFENLKQLSELLEKYIKQDKYTISFYHLDENTIKHYDNEQIETIIKIFEK